MGKKDPRVDIYIANSAAFARPILKHLRKLVHAGCAEVEEGMKWGVPHFLYKGMLASMAAFKAHCAFGFWKGKLMTSLRSDGKSSTAAGHYGRITSLADLPPDKQILAHVREAARLNDDGVKAPAQGKAKAKIPLRTPAFFKAALAKHPAAKAAFDGFSYSHKKEYIEWLSEAKTEATRQKRLATALGWLAEGKSRNWKYL